jgi:hypothetical protein
MIHIHNFDFLVGKSTVLNRRLKERLNNCNEWIEFDAEMDTKKIYNGLIVMDEMTTAYFGEEFIGLSIRMLNPETNIWTIYWADTMSHERQLSEQVVGKFEDGIGLFYGKEMFDGKEIDLRFTWKKETEETALWEQAYYDKRQQTWETNWTMLFTRKQ